MPRGTGATATDAFTQLLDELRADGVANGGEWLARLVATVRRARREDNDAAASRLRALVRLLEERPECAAALASYLNLLLSARMHRVLYADPGVLSSHGFGTGLVRRLLGRLLPPAVDTGYLRDLVDEVFDHPRDHEWMEAIRRDDWDRLLRAIGVDSAAFEPARRRCRHEVLEALRLASVRLAALGTESSLLQYLPALARHESPFLVQAGEMRHFLLGQLGERAADDGSHHEVLLQQCQDYVDAVRRRSREAGVSVDLVYLLARIEVTIERVRRLRGLLVPADSASPEPAAAVRDRAVDFFLRLVRQENRRNSVRDLFRGTTELLARRFTEQASRSGEHYITASRVEFVAMYRAAAGAGFIIAALALLKLKITALHLPLLWEGVAYSLNYGLGFVLIHLLHLTIATKQPAMTATTLAAALDGRDSREARLDGLAELGAEARRTQWVSIAGNVTVTMLTAFAISLTAAQFLGWSAAGAEKAAQLLHDLHPWRSLALLHAAIAGVYLFLSGLISGYYDNQALYHRIPQRLRRVKWLRRALGERRLGRLADYVEHNLGALAGNFLFGCMLGSTPVIGVLLIGLVNLLVSFSLALRVALRSRGITREQTGGMWRRVLRRFLERPRDFFWPPAAAPAT
jgi:site-specific recombinase